MKILTETAEAPVSLGRFLRSGMGLSHHMTASLKFREAIFVNGVPRHTNYYLAAGDEVEVRLEEEGAYCVPFEGDVKVVYEDEDYFVIDKPAPLPTQSSARQSADTLENRMAYHYPDLLFRPVNRLDKGTSGLLTVAKHAQAQYALSALLHTEDFVREYLAVVEGVPAEGAGTVCAPIRKVPGESVKREVHEGGAPSVTHYETLKVQNGLSLVRLRLETGRTHQIRVHMAHLGCPVLGDFLYGRERKEMAGRFALHSHRILLRRPRDGRTAEYVSELPEELGNWVEGGQI